MNMPPIAQEGMRAAPISCFCGQLCPCDSFYCSLECAREDAFNSLTLGKPHESSNPPMAPLPILPPGFFKLPPKRALDEADELALTFATDDHGPFQQARSSPSKHAKKDRLTRMPRSVPRSITTSVTSTVTSKRSKSSSKWRSHYQQTQQHESFDSSTGIPFFLVDEVDSGKGQEQEQPGITAVIDSLALPTPTAEPRQQAQGTELTRGGSFGLAFYPSLTCTAEADSLTPSEYTTDAFKRHSASSYNSLLTSGTSESRSSYTSGTGPSEPSPTTSEYPASLARSQPRLGYGSAFAGHEDKEITVEVVRMVAQLGNSLLLAKRASRKRSSTDATLLASSRQEIHKPEPPTVKENVQVAKLPPPPVSQPLPAMPPKKVTTPIPKAQWPQFGTPMSRSEQSLTTAIPALPLQSRAVNSPSPRSMPGTLVKKTTIASKGRLPIGSSPQVPPRPKTPSNVAPATLNLSLQSKSFCAPAYAMSAPKIPSSTRTLHTSPSKKSLKAQKERGHVRIPSVDVDDQSPGDSFKASFEPRPTTTTDSDVQGSKGSDLLMVDNDRDLASSAQSGSAFKLSIAPKATSKNFTLTLHLDSATLNPPSMSTGTLDDATTPRAASPSCVQDRSPSTAGGPLTPRVTPLGGAQGPAWLVSPTENTTKAEYFTPGAIQRTVRLESSAPNSSELSSSGDEELLHAQFCIARKVTLQTSPSALRTTFDWESTPLTAMKSN